MSKNYNPFQLYTAACKARGCQAAAAKLGWPNGEKKVCRNCARCVTHCTCDSFERADSVLDLRVAAETKPEEF